MDGAEVFLTFVLQLRIGIERGPLGNRQRSYPSTIAVVPIFIKQFILNNKFTVVNTDSLPYVCIHSEKIVA